MSALSTTPDPPYYAVIFASTASSDTADYAEAAARMTALAARQPGFLGVDSARSDGVGITVSYWETEAAIRALLAAHYVDAATRVVTVDLSLWNPMSRAAAVVQLAVEVRCDTALHCTALHCAALRYCRLVGW